MENSYSNVLLSYTKRLITTSSRSRTIFYGKDNGYILDFHSYLKYTNESELKQFLEGNLDKLEIFLPKFNYKKAAELFTKYHNNEITKSDILEYFPTFSSSDFLLIQDSNPNDAEYTKLFNKYDKSNKKLFKQLSKLNDNNETIKKESGKDDLYLGYPYLIGQFNDEKMVRAPLVLHKISITENSNKITLSNENIRILNPVFVMSYLVENDKKYRDHLDFEILETNYLDIAHLILDKIGIETNKNYKLDKLESIPQLTKKDFKSLNSLVNNYFNIKNYLTMGIFPLSNKKIYDDVKELSMEEETNEMLENFYNKNSEYNVFNKTINDIDETSIKYITTLDYTQKKTLIDALNGNLIIQGPPGTGKSQVIANVVANLVLNQKNVLVCSEKRTATDVIYNRLGKLSPFALLLHDNISEKEIFYSAISNAINTIKDNIENLKTNEYNFKQDRYINDFFIDSKNYDEIINNKYSGLTFKEVISYNQKSNTYSKQIASIIKKVNTIDDLETTLYDYAHSDEYKKSRSLMEEASRDFYTKYNLFLDDERIYKLYDLKNELLNTKNNYVINIKINNLINNANQNINFLKKLFLRKQKLTTLSEEFLNKSLHKFSIFKDKIYKTNYEKELISLKLVNNLSDSEIIEEYKSYISKIAYKEIDHTFLQEYTKKFDIEKQLTFDYMDSKIEDSIEFMARSISADIKEVLSQSKFNGRLQQLLGETNKKRKKPIKVIVDEYFEILQVLFPIWIMTPDVVSSIIPLKEKIFDKAIFDEASQLFIEKAVPTIARSKSIVICGDSKQLRPTLFFESRYEDDEDYVEDLEQESAISETSLLDYATSANKYNSSMLKYHYRCNYKELINFSSHAFYNGDLTYASKNEILNNIPLETVNVNGEWNGKTNEIEANTVVKIVSDILTNRQENETIGIVTLNIHQRDLIIDLLDEKLTSNKSLSSIYSKEKERKNPKDDEDESLFVKNLEGVQGDERDIIIFSIAYSKNNKGNIGSSLGELQRLHGENRLNVAISRAKKKIYIVKSFLGNDLEINEDNKGPYYFKKYLQYADYLNDNNEISANQLLINLSNNSNQPTNITTHTEYEKEIFNYINSKIDTNRYELKPNILIGSFKIDMAIFDKIENTYKLGIQCTGNEYHKHSSEVTNDIYKQRYLDIRKWKMIWIFESDYLYNKEKEFAKLDISLKELYKN